MATKRGYSKQNGVLKSKEADMSPAHKATSPICGQEEIVIEAAKEVSIKMKQGKRRGDTIFYKLVRGGNVTLVAATLAELTKKKLTKEKAWLLDKGEASEAGVANKLMTNDNVYFLPRVMLFILNYVAMLALTPLFYLVHGLCYMLSRYEEELSETMDLPLVYAILSENKEMVKLFINKGLKLKHTDENGNNLLHCLFALSRSNATKARICFELICRVFPRDEIHIAVTQLKNNRSLTALDLLAGYGSLDLLKTVTEKDGIICRTILAVDAKEAFINKKEAVDNGIVKVSEKEYSSATRALAKEDMSFSINRYDISSYEAGDTFQRQSKLMKLLTERDYIASEESDMEALASTQWIIEWCEMKLGTTKSMYILSRLWKIAISAIFLYVVFTTNGGHLQYPLAQQFMKYTTTNIMEALDHHRNVLSANNFSFSNILDGMGEHNNVSISDILEALGQNNNVRASEILDAMAGYNNVGAFDPLEKLERYNVSAMDIIIFAGISDKDVDYYIAKVFNELISADPPFTLLQDYAHIGNLICTPNAHVTRYGVSLDSCAWKALQWVQNDCQVHGIDEQTVLDKAGLSDQKKENYLNEVLLVLLVTQISSLSVDILLRTMFMFKNYPIWTGNILNGPKVFWTTKLPASYTEKQLSILSGIVLIFYYVANNMLFDTTTLKEFHEVYKYPRLLQTISLIIMMFQFIYMLRLFPVIGLFIRTTLCLIKNLIEFIIVYTVIGLSFGLVFYFLLVDEQCPAARLEGYENIFSTFFGAYLAMLGQGDLPVELNLMYKIVYGLYSLLSAVMLLNLIIAIMGTTTDKVMVKPWRDVLYSMDRLSLALYYEASLQTCFFPWRKWLTKKLMECKSLVVYEIEGKEYLYIQVEKDKS